MSNKLEQKLNELTAMVAGDEAKQVVRAAALAGIAIGMEHCFAVKADRKKCAEAMFWVGEQIEMGAMENMGLGSRH